MEKEQLEAFINQRLSSSEIGRLTGYSPTQVRRYVGKFNLQLNSRSGPRPKPLKCTKCGETDLTKFSSNGLGHIYRRCKVCHALSQNERYEALKKQCVEYKGGHCIHCNYDKCLASLHFHHRHNKDPEWKKLKRRSFEAIKAELDKCDLVCANCHGELHSGPGLR